MSVDDKVNVIFEKTKARYPDKNKKSEAWYYMHCAIVNTTPKIAGYKKSKSKEIFKDYMLTQELKHLPNVKAFTVMQAAHGLPKSFYKKYILPYYNRVAVKLRKRFYSYYGKMGQRMRSAIAKRRQKSFLKIKKLKKGKKKRKVKKVPIASSEKELIEILSGRKKRRKGTRTRGTRARRSKKVKKKKKTGRTKRKEPSESMKKRWGWPPYDKGTPELGKMKKPRRRIKGQPRALLMKEGVMSKEDVKRNLFGWVRSKRSQAKQPKRSVKRVRKVKRKLKKPKRKKKRVKPSPAPAPPAFPELPGVAARVRRKVRKKRKKRTPTPKRRRASPKYQPSTGKKGPGRARKRRRKKRFSPLDVPASRRRALLTEFATSQKQWTDRRPKLGPLKGKPALGKKRNTPIPPEFTQDPSMQKSAVKMRSKKKPSMALVPANFFNEIALSPSRPKRRAIKAPSTEDLYIDLDETDDENEDDDAKMEYISPRRTPGIKWTRVTPPAIAPPPRRKAIMPPPQELPVALRSKEAMQLAKKIAESPPVVAPRNLEEAFVAFIQWAARERANRAYMPSPPRRSLAEIAWAKGEIDDDEAVFSPVVRSRKAIMPPPAMKALPPPPVEQPELPVYIEEEDEDWEPDMEDEEEDGEPMTWQQMMAMPEENWVMEPYEEDGPEILRPGFDGPELIEEALAPPPDPRTDEEIREEVNEVMYERLDNLENEVMHALLDQGYPDSEAENMAFAVREGVRRRYRTRSLLDRKSAKELPYAWFEEQMAKEMEQIAPMPAEDIELPSFASVPIPLSSIATQVRKAENTKIPKGLRRHAAERAVEMMKRRLGTAKGRISQQELALAVAAKRQQRALSRITGVPGSKRKPKTFAAQLQAAKAKLKPNEIAHIGRLMKVPHVLEVIAKARASNDPDYKAKAIRWISHDVASRMGRKYDLRSRGPVFTAGIKLRAAQWAANAARLKEERRTRPLQLRPVSRKKFLEKAAKLDIDTLNQNVFFPPPPGMFPFKDRKFPRYKISKRKKRKPLFTKRKKGRFSRRGKRVTFDFPEEQPEPEPMYNVEYGPDPRWSRMISKRKKVKPPARGPTEWRPVKRYSMSKRKKRKPRGYPAELLPGVPQSPVDESKYDELFEPNTPPRRRVPAPDLSYESPEQDVSMGFKFDDSKYDDLFKSDSAKKKRKKFSFKRPAPKKKKKPKPRSDLPRGAPLGQPATPVPVLQAPVFQQPVAPAPAPAGVLVPVSANIPASNTPVDPRRRQPVFAASPQQQMVLASPPSAQYVPVAQHQGVLAPLSPAFASNPYGMPSPQVVQQPAFLSAPMAMSGSDIKSGDTVEDAMANAMKRIDELEKKVDKSPQLNKISPQKWGKRGDYDPEDFGKLGKPAFLDAPMGWAEKSKKQERAIGESDKWTKKRLSGKGYAKSGEMMGGACCPSCNRKLKHMKGGACCPSCNRKLKHMKGGKMSDVDRYYGEKEQMAGGIWEKNGDFDGRWPTRRRAPRTPAPLNLLSDKKRKLINYLRQRKRTNPQIRPNKSKNSKRGYGEYVDPYTMVGGSGYPKKKVAGTTAS